MPKALLRTPYASPKSSPCATRRPFAALPLDVVKPHLVPTKAHGPWGRSVVELLQFIQVLQPRQDDLLASLFDLAGKKDLVEDGVDLVKVEDEVELADVAEEGVEDLDKEVDGLEVGELVVIGVNAGAEEEARVPAIDDLVVAKLDEIGLVFLVARRHETVDLERERVIRRRELGFRARGDGDWGDVPPP